MTNWAAGLARLGVASLRPDQDRMLAAMGGAPMVAAMPTGGGKSLLFQAPAAAGGGLGVVVSPLIALQREQVARLRERGVAAAALNSGMKRADKRQVREDIQAGQVELLYASPEMLSSPRLRALLAGQVKYMALDEAHCCSTWGRDFRPAYGRIRETVRALRPRWTMACTATVWPQVLRDVVWSLGGSGARLRAGDLLRRDLYFRRGPDMGRGVDAVLRFLAGTFYRAPGSLPSLIYCESIKDVETLAAGLRGMGGLRAARHHSRLPTREKSETEQGWREGDLDVIACTDTLGLGMDKANVRSVVMAGCPGTLDALYQRAGRASRDGLGGVIVLCSGDGWLREIRLQNRNPTEGELSKLYTVARALSGGSWVALGAREWAEAAHVSQYTVGAGKSILDLHRLIDQRSDDSIHVRLIEEPPARARAQRAAYRFVVGYGRLGDEGLWRVTPDQADDAGIEWPDLLAALRAADTAGHVEYARRDARTRVRTTAREFKLHPEWLAKKYDADRKAAEALEQFVVDPSEERLRRHFSWDGAGCLHDTDDCRRCDVCGVTLVEPGPAPLPFARVLEPESELEPEDDAGTW